MPIRLKRLVTTILDEVLLNRLNPHLNKIEGGHFASKIFKLNVPMM